MTWAPWENTLSAARRRLFQGIFFLSRVWYNGRAKNPWRFLGSGEDFKMEFLCVDGESILSVIWTFRAGWFWINTIERWILWYNCILIVHAVRNFDDGTIDFWCMGVCATRSASDSKNTKPKIFQELSPERPEAAPAFCFQNAMRVCPEAVKNKTFLRCKKSE